jgi:hypothetical protein
MRRVAIRRDVAAIALLLILSLTLLPAASATERPSSRNAAGALTKQYPLGTQTLSRNAASGTTTTGPQTGTSSATTGKQTGLLPPNTSSPTTPSSVSTTAAPRPHHQTDSTRHTQGHGELIIVLIAALVVVGLSLSTIGRRITVHHRAIETGGRSDPLTVPVRLPPKVPDRLPSRNDAEPRVAMQARASEETRPGGADEKDAKPSVVDPGADAATSEAGATQTSNGVLGYTHGRLPPGSRRVTF